MVIREAHGFGALGEVTGVREVADRAFSRAAGAPLVAGHLARLLRDARGNYPAWLVTIASARHHIHFESYIVHDDATAASRCAATTRRAGRLARRATPENTPPDR